jgi:hypothetical protein
MHKTVAVAALSLALSGFTFTSSATANPSADDECAGMSPAAHTSEGNTAPAANDDTVPVLAGDWTDIDVLANDTDVEGDVLSVVTVSQPAHGFTCINGDGTIEYDSRVGTPTGTDTFTYGVTDGDYFRSATVTMSVEGFTEVVPKLTRKLKTGRHGRLIQRAKVTVTNTNNREVEFLAGNFRTGRVGYDRVIAPGATVGPFKTAHHYVDFVAVVAKDAENGDFILVDIRRLNTKTGKVVLESLDDEGLRAGARRTLVRHGFTKSQLHLR